ncbi:hypothetical protein MMC22_001795 [Lobaria immixta]|nr:hypothetical protein [Lobaria immixta]
MAPGASARAPRRLRDQHGKYIRAPAAGSKSSARTGAPAHGRGLTRSTVATPSRPSSSAAGDDEASLDSSRATREPSSSSTDDSVESESVKTESVKVETSPSPSPDEHLVKMDPSVKLELGRSDVEQRVKKRQSPSDFEQRVKKRQSLSDVESSTLQTISAQHRREPTLYVYSPAHEYPIPLKLRSSMTMEMFFASVLGTFGLADRADEVAALKVSLNSLPKGYLTDSWLVRITVPDSFELLLEVISDLPACKKGLPCAIRVDIIYGDVDGDSG